MKLKAKLYSNKFKRVCKIVNNLILYYKITTIIILSYVIILDINILYRVLYSYYFVQFDDSSRTSHFHIKYIYYILYINCK